MAPLHTWSFRDVLAYALGWAVPMLVMYFGAPALQEYLERRGVDVGDAWRFQWWLGIVPYPVPFTTRAGLAIALILVPPIAFVFVWWIARRRAPKLFFTPRSR
jgi:hypothetical protein